MLRVPDVADGVGGLVGEVVEFAAICCSVVLLVGAIEETVGVRVSLLLGDTVGVTVG